MDNDVQRGDPAVRGMQQIGHPVVWGGLIGVMGGAGFAFGGIAGLPEEHRGLLRGLVVALALVALVAILVRRRVLPGVQPPKRGAMRVYWIAVVLMLACFPLTRWVANALSAPGAQIALVAAVVGAHFLPFARAFTAPIFWWIGGAMVVLGLLGAVLAVAGVSGGGPAGALAAGAAMMVVVTVQALRAPSRRGGPATPAPAQSD